MKGDVLDFGCGGGQIASLVSPDRYFGVDISEKALVEARRCFPRHTFGSEVPSGRKFDTVVALAVIEHVKDPASFLKMFANFLKPTGQMVLTTPHPAFRKVHDMGAAIGIFSRDASEEHESFLDHKDMDRYSRAVGLKLAQQKRFLFGANQLFIVQKG